jgi:hypothetical protein
LTDFAQTLARGGDENVDRAELTERRRRYFSAVLRAARLKTMAALAKELNVTQSTLTNIQSTNRSAGLELIEKIRRLAPRVDGAEILSAEALANLAEPTSEVRLSIGERLAQAYGERIHELQGVEEDEDTNTEEIRRNFDAMDKDDVFIYLSAVTRPLEMDPNETKLKKSIANAIQRQAFFVYLRPTKAYLQSAGDFVDIPTQFSRFRTDVVSNISNTKSIQDKCRQRVILIQTDANPLFAVPDFKWELFYSDKIDAPYKAAARALVVSGRAPNHPGPRIRIPLSATTTKRVLFELAKTIYFGNASLEHPDQIPFDIITRLKESAEMATGQKINSS